MVTKVSSPHERNRMWLINSSPLGTYSSVTTDVGQFANLGNPSPYIEQRYTFPLPTGHLHPSNSGYFPYQDMHLRPTVPSSGGPPIGDDGREAVSAEPEFISRHESATQDVQSQQDQRQEIRRTPRCWEHGCNGRRFSTFSNLLRHQRERAGTAPKSYCPRCRAEFTRTTARNGHMAHAKCKVRRASDLT